MKKSKRTKAGHRWLEGRPRSADLWSAVSPTCSRQTRRHARGRDSLRYGFDAFALTNED
jgi:hypothetical protein